MDSMLNDVSIERVIQELTVLREFWAIRFTSDEAKEEFKNEMDIAIKAVKKQIPKEPSFFICGTGCYYRCPNCEEKIYSSNITFLHDEEYVKLSGENKYCRNCGKRLRWTNDD